MSMYERNFNVQTAGANRPFWDHPNEPVFVRVGKPFNGKTHYFTAEEAREFHKKLGEAIDQLPKEPTAHEVFRKRVVDSPIGTVLKGGAGWLITKYIKVDDNLWHSQTSGLHYTNADFAVLRGDEKYYTFV